MYWSTRELDEGRTTPFHLEGPLKEARKELDSSMLLYQYCEEKESQRAALKDQRRDSTGPGVKEFPEEDEALPWRVSMSWTKKQEKTFQAAAKEQSKSQREKKNVSGSNELEHCVEKEEARGRLESRRRMVCPTEEVRFTYSCTS